MRSHLFGSKDLAGKSTWELVYSTAAVTAMIKRGKLQSKPTNAAGPMEDVPLPAE